MKLILSIVALLDVVVVFCQTSVFTTLVTIKVNTLSESSDNGSARVRKNCAKLNSAENYLDFIYASDYSTDSFLLYRMYAFLN